jgi:hypothetical protein
MEQSPKSKYLGYLRPKATSAKDDDLKLIISKIMTADPEPNCKNCEWLIDAYIANEFKLYEDEERVKEDIIKFKKIFGNKRPLPVKGYKEMKVMIRQKSELPEKKSMAKTKEKVKTIFTDCKDYFKNVKKTLPENYKNLESKELESLFEKIEETSRNVYETSKTKIKIKDGNSQMSICMWIVEELKRGHFGEDDLPEVEEYLINYFETPHSQFPLPNFYPEFPSYNNYQLIQDYVSDVIGLQSDEKGILLVPATKSASCYYGGQTSWCTARKDEHNMFDYYSKKGYLYIWFDRKLKDKFQFHFQSEQFMDRDDNPIPTEKVKYFRNHPSLAGIFYEQELKILNKLASDIDTDSKKALKKILQYVKNVFGGKRWPEAEKILIQNNYVKGILKYATDAIKEPWPEAENIILSNADINGLTKYAINRGVRWPEAERILLKTRNVDRLTTYARWVIKGRWPEEEKLIMAKLIDNPMDYQNIDDFIMYALFLKMNNYFSGRWPEVEKILLASMNLNGIIQYAQNIMGIGVRWPEAERILVESGFGLAEYATKVINGPWPEVEDIMIEKDNDIENVINYATKFDRKEMLDKIAKKYSKYLKNIFHANK